MSDFFVGDAISIIINILRYALAIFIFGFLLLSLIALVWDVIKNRTEVSKQLKDFFLGSKFLWSLGLFLYFIASNILFEFKFEHWLSYGLVTAAISLICLPTMWNDENSDLAVMYVKVPSLSIITIFIIPNIISLGLFIFLVDVENKSFWEIILSTSELFAVMGIMLTLVHAIIAGVLKSVVKDTSLETFLPKSVSNAYSSMFVLGFIATVVISLVLGK